jgi:TP901 family phage tail tape measure protein
MSERNLRINLIFAAFQKVTSPMRAVAMGSKAMSGELKKSTDALAALNRQQANITGYKQMNTQLRETRRELEAAETRFKSITTEIGLVEKPTSKMSRELAKAQKEVAGLSGKYNDQRLALDRLKTGLNDAGIGTTGLSEHQKRLRADIGRTSAEIDQQKAKLGALKDREDKLAAGKTALGNRQQMGAGIAVGGAAAVGAGVAIAAPLVGAIRDASAFEAKMTSIGQKAGLSRAQTRLMGDDFRQISGETNQTAEELQTGVDVLTGFGMAAKESLKIIKPIGMAATAYMADMGDLSKATFASIDNLKAPAESTTQILDVMAEAGKRGAFEMRDMAQYFPALTASAKALGQEGVPAVADLAAALQITRKGAGDSGTAANNLQNLLDKINTEETIGKFKKFGIALPQELKKAADAGKSPVEAIVELTKRATGGNLDQLGFLFGDAQVKAALRPLVQNFEEFKKIRAQALGAKNVVSKDFAERMKDAAEAEQEAAIAAGNLSATIGQQLLPTYTEILNKGKGLLEHLGNFARANPGLTKSIGLAAFGLAAFLVVTGGLAIGVGAILGPLALLRYSFLLAKPAGLVFSGSLKAIGGAFGTLTRVLMANPILLIVAGIALAALAIYNHWDKIGPYFWAAMEGLKQIFLGAVGLFKAIFWDFQPAVLIYTHWGKITGWFGSLWAGVKAVFSAAWVGIKGLMSGWATSALGVGASIIGAIGSGIKNGAGAIWEVLKSTVFGAINRVKQFFGGGTPTAPTVRTAPLPPRPKLAGARALGGPVLRGLNYLVGERGPEIFTPDDDGQIIPNNALGGRRARSFFTGSAIAALAASPAYASPSAPRGGAVQGDKIEITFKNAKREDIPDIEAAVLRILEQREREKAARRRSSYADDDA